METQNVTLSLPKPLPQRAKIAAAQRNVSLSKLLAMALEQTIDSDDEYERAREFALRYLDNPQPLGSTEPRTWTRDDLYDR
jgi:hypothetical protein